MPAYFGRPHTPTPRLRACRASVLGLTAATVAWGPTSGTDAANATHSLAASTSAGVMGYSTSGYSTATGSVDTTVAPGGLAVPAVPPVPGLPAVPPVPVSLPAGWTSAGKPLGEDVRRPVPKGDAATGKKSAKPPAERTAPQKSRVPRKSPTGVRPKATGARAHRAASRKASRQTLGPRATLARTPVARSTNTTRLAARAFPGFVPFTWVGPVSATRQTSGFGRRWGRPHAGLDFAGPVGTRLKSLSDGRVTLAGRQGGYGNKVEIMHWDGSLVAYGHLDSIAVTQGQRVGPGHVIGRLGNTGRSTGPHLHLEVRPGGGEAIDPWPWLVQRGILPRDAPKR